MDGAGELAGNVAPKVGASFRAMIANGLQVPICNALLRIIHNHDEGVLAAVAASQAFHTLTVPRESRPYPASRSTG